MAFDTLLCITNIIGIGNIFTSLIEVKSVELCYFIPFFAYFTNACNRLLTVGIVIYRSTHLSPIKSSVITFRYMFVIKNHLVRTTAQRRALGTLIFGSILITSFTMTVWSFYYMDVSYDFQCNIDKSIMKCLKFNFSLLWSCARLLLQFKQLLRPNHQSRIQSPLESSSLQSIPCHDNHLLLCRLHCRTCRLCCNLQVCKFQLSVALVT